MFIRPLICPHCNQMSTYNLADYVTESEVIDDRQMGEETEHVVSAEELICKHCGEVFGVKGSIWEYPKNAYNTDDLETFI